MARVNLELPLAYKPEDLDRILNERLRRIAGLLTGSTSSTKTTQVSGAIGGVTTLMLSVAGTISIRSSATPLVAFSSSRAFTSITALLKTAASGGDIVIRLLVDGAERAAMTVPAGAIRATAAINVTVAAGALVTVDITAAGSIYPGADLTLLLS